MSHDDLEPGVIIKLRRDTTINWSTDNPVLAEGETGWDTDLLRVKLGDGVTAWNDLPYAIDGPEGEVDTVATVPPVAGDIPTAALKTALSLPSNTVTDLGSLDTRVDAIEATEATYGDIVTHNASEFTTDAELLAKPVVRPNTIALLGDSITFFNGAGEGIYDTPVSNPYHHSQGYFTWANIALGGRLTLTRQAGIGGNTSAQMLARITDITGLPVMPGFCLIMGGSNDMLNDVPSTTTITNLTAIHDALIAKGITVIACTTPYIWSNVASRLLAQAEVNDWIRDQANKPGIIVCDWAASYANPNGDGTPAPGYSTDGVHPTIIGAAVLGKQLADAIRFHVNGSQWGLASTNIEPTNLLANGLMIGTLGSLNTGSAGVLATSWNAGRTVGSGTLTCSKVARVDGFPGSWQELNIDAGGGTFIMYQDASPAGIAAGQKYIAEMEYEGLVPTDIKRFTMTLAEIGGSAGGYSCEAGTTMVYPTQVPAGVMRTPVVTLNGTPTALRTSVDLIGTDGTVRVSRIRLRRVT